MVKKSPAAAGRVNAEQPANEFIIRVSGVFANRRRCAISTFMPQVSYDRVVDFASPTFTLLIA